MFSPRPLFANFVLCALVGSTSAFAFEDTKVLPKGVRNLSIRTVDTNFNQTTDPSGGSEPLAHLLYQDLTFAQVVRDDTKLKGAQLKGFMLQNGIQDKDSIGSFSADITGHLTVIAPIMAFGISSKLTLALATPIYQAQTKTNVGFVPNERAQNLMALLAKPENAQIANGREAAGKLNDAVNRLNNKLANNNFQRLNAWNSSGPGDATLAAKYQYIDNSVMGIASTTGVVMPTGRRKDPDVLNDIPFGEGVWAPFAQIAVDEKLPQQFTVNQYAKYTLPLPGQKSVRTITYDELVEVGSTNAHFKEGDKIDAGTSLRYDPSFGLVSGIGYTFFHKYGDVYRGDGVSSDSKKALQRWTDQTAHNAEFMLGYSTVPLYQQGRVPVPFSLRASYVKQLAGRNMPITNLAQFDFDLFF